MMRRRPLFHKLDMLLEEISLIPYKIAMIPRLLFQGRPSAEELAVFATSEIAKGWARKHCQMAYGDLEKEPPQECVDRMSAYFACRMYKIPDVECPVDDITREIERRRSGIVITTVRRRRSRY